jgi:hypothetical protein
MNRFEDLTKEQLHVPLNRLLCNWPDCKVDNGRKAPAERLCPSCNCVGYCCIWCMQQDWKRHITEECQRVICLKCTTYRG